MYPVLTGSHYRWSYLYSIGFCFHKVFSDRLSLIAHAPDTTTCTSRSSSLLLQLLVVNIIIIMYVVFRSSSSWLRFSCTRSRQSPEAIRWAIVLTRYTGAENSILFLAMFTQALNDGQMRSFVVQRVNIMYRTSAYGRVYCVFSLVFHPFLSARLRVSWPVYFFISYFSPA